MFSHLLSKMPAPRAADWGFGVSVGIVVICDNYKGIVSVSDTKATFADFSADHAAIKARRIYRNWWVVYAGNDVEYAPGIIADAEESLDRGCEDDPPFKKAKQIVAALHDAYWSAVYSQIENRVLRKQKFTVDSFRETGSKKCTATIYNNMCAKIDRVELSLQFLLYGFSEDGRAHIYLVDGGDAPKCYDTVGVWAIGSGAHAALSSLAFHIDCKELNKHATKPEKAAYFACEAKFMAESSGQVGKDMAILAVHRANEKPTDARIVLQAEISKIKEIWKAQGAPRVPPNIEEQVAALLNPKKTEAVMPSDSQTSGSEQ
jgi:hypothetical protein